MSTTTYTSTNRRPCPIHGHCTPACTARADWEGIGDVYLADGSRYLVLAEPAVVLPTVPVIDIAAHPADYVTMTGVIQASQEAAEGRSGAGRVPVRYVALVFLGLVLMGIGMARNELAALIWLVIGS